MLPGDTMHYAIADPQSLQSQRGMAKTDSRSMAWTVLHGRLTKTPEVPCDQNTFLNCILYLIKRARLPGSGLRVS
jgi:hypothetical protein